jgi:hypothetical protein
LLDLDTPTRLDLTTIAGRRVPSQGRDVLDKH